MAKLKQGILGGISGTVGNVVGSSWKGIDVIKSKPLSVANPKTTAQTAQRTKFTNAVNFTRRILTSIVKPLWDRFSIKQSGYNAFLRENIDLFENPMPNPASNLVISTGKMRATVPEIHAINAGDTEMDISFSSSSDGPLMQDTDEAYALVIEEETGNISTSSGLTSRIGASVLVNMPEAVTAGNTLHVYLAFRRSDGTVVSNTGYASKVLS